MLGFTFNYMSLAFVISNSPSDCANTNNTSWLTDATNASTALSVIAKENELQSVSRTAKG